MKHAEKIDDILDLSFSNISVEFNKWFFMEMIRGIRENIKG